MDKTVIWHNEPESKRHWHSCKENVPGATVSKEGHAVNILGYESTHDNWFPWKRSKCKVWFLLPTPLEKFASCVVMSSERA